MHHGNSSSSLGDCLRHFGTPNGGYISRALAGERLGPAELVYSESPCRAYAGTGVPPQEHPMSSWMRGVRCLDCSGSDVLVVAAETTSTMGGDTYFNCAVRCTTCQTYSSFSADDA